MPSRIETQGMVMIEEMAAGLVVISSDRGGIRESIRHGQTGVLLEDPTDLDAATAAIEAVLNNLSGWTPVRIAARREVEARFSWETIVPRLESIYAEILEGSP
ncbi:glycosyltransferase [Thiobacter sp. AK1]|uniref:Glycosyltransferase n=1 Tax=Thiobacter aerophilum TaxID=3121275 RepID=A0ABV0ECM4_9BURK